MLLRSEEALQTSSSRASRGIRYLAIGTSLGGIGLIVACLEATEIVAAVSSDTSICSPKPRSVGAALHKARYAVVVRHADAPTKENVREIDGELDRCDSSQGTAFVGSFTVFPETSDARAHVEIIQLTVDTLGGNPGDCSDLDAEGRPQKLPSNCIVLRRRVRFVENRGLRVPMYLDDRCLGVSCGEDQTCFRSKCVGADTTCDGSSCLPNHERNLGGDGAGFDPTKLADLPPGDTNDATDGAQVDEAGNTLGDSAPSETSVPSDAESRDASNVPDGDVGTVNKCALCGPTQKCCTPTPEKGPFYCRDNGCKTSETTCSRSTIDLTPGTVRCVEEALPN
jgi:hypothetical protein